MAKINWDTIFGSIGAVVLVGGLLLLVLGSGSKNIDQPKVSEYHSNQSAETPRSQQGAQGNDSPAELSKEQLLEMRQREFAVDMFQVIAQHIVRQHFLQQCQERGEAEVDCRAARTVIVSNEPIDTD